MIKNQKSPLRRLNRNNLKSDQGKAAPNAIVYYTSLLRWLKIRNPPKDSVLLVFTILDQVLVKMLEILKSWLLFCVLSINNWRHTPGKMLWDNVLKTGCAVYFYYLNHSELIKYDFYFRLHMFSQFLNPHTELYNLFRPLFFLNASFQNLAI